MNIYTAMDAAAREFNSGRFAEYGAYLDYTKGLTVAVKEVVKRHMALFAEV